MNAIDPRIYTMNGRLSYPTFSYKEALVNNAKSPNPNPDAAKVTPEFNLLVTRSQLDKYIKYIKDELFPYFLSQNAADPKTGLDQANLARIMKIIDAEDWDNQPPYIPIKKVSDKTAALMPTAVASIKIKGNRAVDIDQMAMVRSEKDFNDPIIAADMKAYPAVVPVGQTIYTLYSGAMAAATLNHYCYLNGKVPGFSASAGTCVFKGDAEKFGGGLAIDEDSIFLDD